MSTAMTPLAASAAHASPPTAPASSAPMPAPYRLSVAQYHLMARTGILRSGEPVELLEGVLVTKMTVNSPHIFTTHFLMDFFMRSLPVGHLVYVQSPITTADSEPEPDIAVVRGDRRQYLVQDRKPGPADIHFLIEVSDSSLTFDQTTKLQIYARARIEAYWIIDVIGKRVAVYTGPTGPGAVPSYQHRQDFSPGQEIPVHLDGQHVGRIVVAELFL